ncbi:MAG: hypothetical protein ABS59_19475 [Methylobacterium sp. SCN 67-24]|nr:MAG: hypothetical protein ABS59_19475 [Methylobacterium sp. SCN 67-24]
MTAYAIAHLRDVDRNAEIIDYILRIDETLVPFGGRFLIHGVTPEILEGPWEGDLVVIAFPDREAAQAWYASPGYQAILPLRTNNSRSAAFIVEGAPEGYRATDFLAKLG